MGLLADSGFELLGEELLLVLVGRNALNTRCLAACVAPPRTDLLSSPLSEQEIGIDNQYVQDLF